MGQGSTANIFEKSWLDRFLALLPIGSSVLDIGCGTAEPIARYIIEAGHALTGVDSSTTMIGICERRFPNHDWLIADMRSPSVKNSMASSHGTVFHLTHEAQRRMFPIFSGRYWGGPLYHSSLDEVEYISLLNNNGFEAVAHVADDPQCDGHTVWVTRLR